MQMVPISCSLITTPFEARAEAKAEALVHYIRVFENEIKFAYNIIRHVYYFTSYIWPQIPHCNGLRERYGSIPPHLLMRSCSCCRGLLSARGVSARSGEWILGRAGRYGVSTELYSPMIKQVGTGNMVPVHDHDRMVSLKVWPLPA